MFDFYFGEREEVLSKEKDFLISVKRMLPRWCNSIPDSEFEALIDDLNDSNVKDPSSQGVMVETGCGASTIPLVYFAMRYGKRVYSWDFNQNKLAYIRSVIVDTIERVFRQSVFDHWTYVPYISTSPDLGIPILGELNETVDFGFYDSEHTRKVLLKEIEDSSAFFNDGAIVALDDANYDFDETNIAYINIMRRKLGLPPITDGPDNRCGPFHEEVFAFLEEKFARAERRADSYKKTFKDDIFWSYYKSDRQIMSKFDMEKVDQLMHRYDSMTVFTS
jgi:hypothetical protein